ncbi:MAG: hypothetical protein Q9214_004167 [Letrouitia sp. 1 TL-2023]
MPGLIRKLVIFAAVDGLILQPSSHRSPHVPSSLQIKYTTQGDVSVGITPKSDRASFASLDAHGIVGLLNVASTPYLIAISRRQQVALIRGAPIYVITGVALIPLSSQLEARKAIERTRHSLRSESHDQDIETSEDSEHSEHENDHTFTDHEEEHPERTHHRPVSSGEIEQERSEEDKTGIAEDVISRKGQYGRFAERWFSRKGWSNVGIRAQGMSIGGSKQSGDSKAGNQRDQDVQQAEQKSQSLDSMAQDKNNVTSTLVPKLLRTTKLLLTSWSFFFSYDFDITRRIGIEESRRTDVPLHRSVDPLFFWNQHVIQPFTESGNHAWVLPIMQGFVGQRAFTIQSNSVEDQSKPGRDTEQGAKAVIASPKKVKADDGFLLTLISRRSVKRPGLRYLRRGVDEEGHTANTVETEQILSRASWAPSGKVYSFTQIRGSIPLYFSQSPYSFKPVPILQRSHETNHAAFQRHFTYVTNRYGKTQIALLVDKTGGEAEIGQKYEEHTKQLNEERASSGVKIGFEWFDFHAVCRGMKFDNVSLLVESLDSTLDDFSTTVESNGTFLRRQTGVLRTNCMDCLDRTNVVQSACGSRALEKQLMEEDISINLQTDTSTQWFNELWADNGDAISKQYSSTAALKGDYTRTRRRDYRGALNDLGLTLSRYYNNMVNDYFSQAAIDFLQGNVTDQVFADFEVNMMSYDPAVSMQKIRANAIETSSKIVIADQAEDMIAGWTLLSPREPNTVRTFPFEENVLLLTDAALYSVRFDWNSEKVSLFERVDLRSIMGIMRGSYITSVLAAPQMDESRNVGMVIKYRPGKQDVARVNTRSLSTSVGQKPADSGSSNSARPSSAVGNLFDLLSRSRSSSSSSGGGGKELRLLALKALPARSPSLANHEDAAAVSEQELVGNICDEIQRAAFGADGEGGGSDVGLRKDFIEEREIISLDEARRSTGYLEQWGHSLKKLVWA